MALIFIVILWESHVILSPSHLVDNTFTSFTYVTETNFRWPRADEFLGSTPCATQSSSARIAHAVILFRLSSYA